MKRHTHHATCHESCCHKYIDAMFVIYGALSENIYYMRSAPELLSVELPVTGIPVLVFSELVDSYSACDLSAVVGGCPPRDWL